MKEKTMTVEEIIASYLRIRCMYHPVESHELETALPRYGEAVYGIWHMPGTYSRAFRKMREKGLEQYGFKITKEETLSRGKIWHITLNTHTAQPVIEDISEQ